MLGFFYTASLLHRIRIQRKKKRKKAETKKEIITTMLKNTTLFSRGVQQEQG